MSDPGKRNGHRNEDRDDDRRRHGVDGSKHHGRSGLGPVHRALFEADDDEDVENDAFLDPSFVDHETPDDNGDDDEDEFDPFSLYQDEEDD